MEKLRSEDIGSGTLLITLNKHKKEKNLQGHNTSLETEKLRSISWIPKSFEL